MWGAFVEAIRSGIFAAAHVCGGSVGGGILLASALVRLGLLPLTLRMARQARVQQRRLLLIQGDLNRLQKTFANDPVALMRATSALRRAHGIRFMQPSTLLSMLVQAPLLAGLFGAIRSGLGQRVRFLWIADMARTNGMLIAIVALLSAGAALVAPASVPPAGQAGNTQWLVALIALISTACFLWSASSAVALSWGSGALVSVLQNVLLARDARRDIQREATVG